MTMSKVAPATPTRMAAVITLGNADAGSTLPR